MHRRDTNTRSTLRRRRRRGDAMAAFDRLPVALRHWLAQAALPWSPSSALRLWTRALQAHGGDASAAARYLSRVESALLARDGPAIWGVAPRGARTGS
ncbi:DUF6525 family protein [Pseudooceanicola nanhaiensis]|uniref:DUF6525 family protein n=1 Tax=Pseudooceanicola nanhaiensis TaxID=375761 RepID=UPI001CD6DA09|nr:DUF6525 family protein [Pseudooceanicola nanhaiensis]MCA0919903.1 DUF6525 family protein [Pseudooceanicola nanhaiensis]